MNSVFDPDELKKEKDVIFEEIKMIEDNPEDLAGDLLLEMVFRGTALEQSIIGTRESLEGIARDSIIDFLSQKYTTDNIVISVAGSFDADHICELFNESFLAAQSGKSRTPGHKAQYEPSYQVRVKDVEQSHICMGVKGIAQEDPLYFPMALLNNIIGGSMSSRLFQNIREQKGLAYSVYSSSNSYVTDGIYSIYAGVSHTKIEAAIDAIAEEMKLVKTSGIGSEELSIAKEQLKSSYVFSQENVNNRMYANGKNTLLLSRVLTAQEIIERIDQVEEEAMLRATDLIADIGRYSAVLVSSKDYDICSKILGLAV
jgi:predicted Zn-dependent peptidase